MNRRDVRLIRRSGNDFTRAARPRQDALSRADVQHRFNSVYAIASSRTGVVLRHIVTAWILPRVIGGLGSPLVLLPQPGVDRARGMSPGGRDAGLSREAFTRRCLRPGTLRSSPCWA